MGMNWRISRDSLQKTFLKNKRVSGMIIAYLDKPKEEIRKEVKLLILTTSLKLELNSSDEHLLRAEMKKYIACVNSLVSLHLSGVSIQKFSSKDVGAELPAAVKNQAIRDAKSVLRRYAKKQWKVERKRAWFAEQGKTPKHPIRDAKVPILRRPVLFVNNQNFKIDLDAKTVSVPLFRDGETAPRKTTRNSVQKEIHVAAVTPRQREILTTTPHLATLRIVHRGDKLLAQVGYTVEESETDSLDALLSNPNTLVMGVDLGIKCPAVSYSTDGKVRFYGNGRENRYKRRKCYARRQKLQKAKKLRAIKRISDKEARFMKDRDHQVSRAIVNEAIRQGAKVIALEDLDGIREGCTQSTPTRKSRKNVDKPKVDSVVENAKNVTDASTSTGEPVQLELFSESEVLTKKERRKKRKLSKKQIAARRKSNRSLNSWSFYRLAKFIEYKAALAGIIVIRVNPYKTSQRCPHCGKEHKARDRRYECECGFHAHRDVVGAINIAKNVLKR